MNVTAIRESVKERLEQFGEVQVWISPTEYGGSFGTTDELNLSAKIIVGVFDDAGVEEKVDELFEAVPEAIADDPSLAGVVSDASVKACSGHKLFAQGPNNPTMVGVDFKIGIVAE